MDSNLTPLVGAAKNQRQPRLHRALQRKRKRKNKNKRTPAPRSNGNWNDFHTSKDQMARHRRVFALPL